MWKVLFAGVVLATTAADAAVQRRGTAATAVLAIVVTDAEGTPVPGVLITVEGAAQRTARTEAGRIAFENLPVGTYRLRFEHERFITLEREVAARAGKPIDVKVALNPVPPPPPAPPPVAPPRPTVTAKPMAADLPALIEKEFVGRAPSRVSALACGAGGTALLIQLNQPLALHTHDDADEFLYVVAGEGTAEVGTGKQRMKAGVFLFVPRGMTHTLTPAGRHPLILMSTRAGEPCP